MSWITNYLWLIPVLPLVAAGLTSVMPRPCRKPSWMLAVGSMGISFLLSLVAFAATLGGDGHQVFRKEVSHYAAR